MITKPSDVPPINLHAPEIPRAHLIRTLETLLDGEIEIVVVEGPDGMGKSMLLRQFAEAHPGRTFSLFLSAASRWVYDPRQVGQELYAQIAAYLASGAEAPEIVDQVALGRLYNELRRQVRRDGRPFYFILDGLEDIPQADEGSRIQLLTLLPFGMEGFRFLLSGRSADELPFEMAARRLVKGYPLSYFGNDESGKYLDGLGLTAEQIDEIVKTTRGLPGKLASVRRLLTSSRDPAQLIASLPEELPGLFQLEWAVVDERDQNQCLALAILAHENRTYSRSELAEISGVPAEEIERTLSVVTFVERDAQGVYRFPSEANRRFVAGRLAQFRQTVNELLIAHLSRDPESKEALEHLPAYFTSAERLLDLVQYLSPERFARMYRKTPSLSMVQKHADRGIDAARRLGREDDLVRFSLQRSTIEEIASSRAGVAEVRARAAVGDYNTALALAESASRTEVRLQLLAAIARVRNEHGLPEDTDLNSRIRELFGHIDPDTLGRQLPDVAADLFHTSPELAIELVSKQPKEQRGENAIDWAITGLTIEAQLSATNPNAKRQARELHEQIKDPTLRRLSMQAIAVLGNLPAAEVIAEAGRIESTGDRLFLLQHWMAANRKRHDASEVLEHGLRLAIQATSYTATARVYRKLATCLPYISEPERLGELVELLDGQRAVLEKLGPPEDYIRLQLIIARAVAQHNPVDAHERLLSIYNEVCGEGSVISDAVVKVAATARLAATLSRVDPVQRMDQDLHALVDQELEEGVEQILAESAEHFEVCRGVIQALAVARPHAALAIIRKINTEWRRDLGYNAFVETAITAPLNEMPLSEIIEALDEIVDPQVYDFAAGSLALLTGRSLASDEVAGVQPLIERIAEIRDSATRVTTCASVAAWLARSGLAAEQMRRQLLQIVEDSWTAMDASWEKLDAGFEVLAEIARTDRQATERYVKEINELQRNLLLHDAETTLAANLGVLLAIRAFAGLLSHQLEGPDDLERLYATISRCGSVAEQARLLSELAVRCHLAKRDALCAEVVRTRLLPLLTTIPEADTVYRSRTIVDSAPALYLGSPAAGRTLVRSLAEPWRDEALGLIAWTLLMKVPLTDAFEHRPLQGFRITFEDASAVIELIREMAADRQIYSLIVAVVESALESNTEIKRPQKAEIARQLEEIASTKFLSPRFIQHEGYRIASQAQINRLRLPHEMITAAALAAEARNIPNTADRAYVLAVVAATARSDKERRAYLDEARAIVDSIPMLVDRLDRYEMMSSLVLDVEPRYSKDLLETALKQAAGGQGSSIEERRRSLINAAYRISPEFASGIAQVSDDDPAKKKVERQLQLYQIRDAIAERRPPPGSVPQGSAFDYAHAAWLKLGTLNARRISPVAAQHTLPLLQYAAPQPVSKAYPLFALYIENAVRHAPSAPVVRRYVLPLFEACLRGAELAVLTADRHSSLGSRGLPYLTGNADGEAHVVEEGEREKAIEFIRRWLSEQPEGVELFIMEPYFRPGDVHLLALVRDVVEEATVTIVTGRDALKTAAAPYEDAYRAAWSRIRQDDPPDTTVIIAGARHSGKFPVHDRWWLTEAGGVEIGTSFGGLGSRVSRIRRLDAAEAKAILQKLDPYFSQIRLEFEGERMTYSSFTL